MADSFDLVIKGGECLTPAGRLRTDIGVRGGRIAALGDLGAAAATETFDARGLTVLPGVIDTQVHFREPGQEHKEDLESGTRAAALGGVTAVFEMPNTRPSTTNAAAMADKVARTQGRVWCDIAFFMGASPENAGDLATLERVPGCCGVKMFMGSSTGTLLVSEDADVKRVLENGNRRVAVHSEDEARLEERKHIARDAAGPHAHADWRDVETALRSTKRLLKLARETGRPVHVLHVTTGDEIPVLAAHKDIATVEVTPQHLTLAAPEAYDRLGTLAQMNPPIRGEAHRTALWQAVADGVVDVIGSDHAPHSLEEKGHAYPNSPSGMPGVQTLVPLLLDHVNAGRLTLERFVDLTSAGPQRIYNIAGKGRIAVGYDGDFTIVDMKAQRMIENAWIASKCGWTPFDGMRVSGWPKATIVRGAIVMREDELAEAPSGGIVRFVASGQP
ncbi:MAG: dihydroorotase [Alphaproteobacteria bacterium]|nr:dihydroorotase [Alphaproteobacteria bacterium]